jgi:hypothetical protein
MGSNLSGLTERDPDGIVSASGAPSGQLVCQEEVDFQDEASFGSCLRHYRAMKSFCVFTTRWMIVPCLVAYWVLQAALWDDETFCNGNASECCNMARLQLRDGLTLVLEEWLKWCSVPA